MPPGSSLREAARAFVPQSFWKSPAWIWRVKVGALLYILPDGLWFVFTSFAQPPLFDHFLIVNTPLCCCTLGFTHRKGL